MADFCWDCHLNHAALGLELKGHVLYRRARGSSHVLRIGMGGGAWGIRSDFWDPHKAEIARVEVLDTETGITYVAEADAFRHAFRKDLGFGEQVILALAHWRRVLPSTGPTPLPAPAPERSAVFQPTLIDLPGSETTRRRHRAPSARQSTRDHKVAAP